MKVGRLSILILIFTLIGLVGCPEKRSSSKPSGSGLYDTGRPKNSDGGQFGGGGSTGQSTPEQVNAAIDQAIKMALEPDFSENIFVQFIVDDTYPAENSGDNDRMDVVLKPHFVFPDHKEGAFSEKYYASKMLKAFGTNEIERIPKGDCPHPPDEETADASVSELSTSAKICFSVGNLTKLPPSILLREVLGLVIHEASHMGKAKEPDAKKYSKYFIKYFASRFGDITVDDFTPKTTTSIKFANVRIKRALELAKIKNDSPNLYAMMGGVLGAINSTPYMDDALAIKLKARPAHPEFVENFWYLLNLVSQQISSSFEPAWELQNMTLVPYMGRIAYPEEVLGKIEEQAKNTQCLVETLEAFTSGKLRKECIAKKLSVTDKVFFLPRNISRTF